MQLRLLGAVLYYLGPMGRQGTVDLGPCLASHKVQARQASTCYLTVPMGINAIDLRVPGHRLRGRDRQVRPGRGDRVRGLRHGADGPHDRVLAQMPNVQGADAAGGGGARRRGANVAALDAGPAGRGLGSISKF